MEKEKAKKVMERLMKPLRLRSSKDRKPLSEEQKHKRARFIVYPLMFLPCLGSFYLVPSPSGQEQERQDKGQGFNTEIPPPEDSRLEGNKKDVYEKVPMEQESRKRKTFFEAAESMFVKEERKDSVRLPDNIPPERQVNTEAETEKGNVGLASPPAGAYREMNRTLGSTYGPRADPEKERLLERIEELERTQQQQQKQEPLSGMEEKTALTEKSYELATKYNNRQAVETLSPIRKVEDRKAMPVKQVHNEVVSPLSGSMSDEEFISAFPGERNVGFNTAVGWKTVTEGNTIAACAHGIQTISDGQALRLQFTEPISVAGRFISGGAVLVGGTRIRSERLEIMVNVVEYKGTILPVELEVYDLDGQQGILVSGSLEYDAAREIAANMGTSMDSSTSISTDAGAQIASDSGKSVTQGVSQYISKQMRMVKITLKAGHRILFHSPEKRNTANYERKNNH